MPERRLDLPDAGLAFLIGAVTGIGAVLLLRAPDDETELIIRSLREHGVTATRVSRRRSRELDDIIDLARSIRNRTQS